MKSHITNSRSYWGIDISTDNALVIVEMKVKPIKWETNPRAPRFDVKQLKDTNILMGNKSSPHHQLEIRSSHPQVEEDWETVKNAIKSAQENIPLKKKTSPGYQKIP